MSGTVNISAGSYISKRRDGQIERTPAPASHIVQQQGGGVLSNYLEVINPGTEDAYLRCKLPFAGDYNIQGYSDFSQFPTTIWDDMPVASGSVLGGIKVGSGLTIAAGVLSVAGGVGTWGGITGTLADQTDLYNALAAKADLVGGIIPSAQLPSFVDDVLEYATSGSFPGTGESGKIYVALDTNITYRWGGSSYVEISQSLALGETSSTAYRGDRGKTAYDHSQAAHVPFSNPIFTGNITITGTTNDMKIGESAVYGYGISSAGAAGGGWARRYGFYNKSTEALLGGYGALGNNDTLTNLWVGRDYNDHSALFNLDGGCEFYYDNTLKLQTTSSGITISGAFIATSHGEIKTTAGDYALMAFSSAADRWNIGKDNGAESGSNAGSDYRIYGYDDSGGYLRNPLLIRRSTGHARFESYLGIGSEPSHRLTVSENRASDVAAYIYNVNSSGYGAKIMGGNASNYALHVTDYSDTSIALFTTGLLTVSGAVKGTSLKTTNWSFEESGNDLLIKRGSTTLAKITSAGVIQAADNIQGGVTF